jgi:subfamily B ATP-binding cassette protein MsbA
MLLIKAFNYEDEAAGKFRAENLSFFNQTMRYLRAAALSGPLMEFCGALIMTVILYYGGREIISGRMTTGDFFTFLAAFFTAYAPTKNLAKLNSELQRGLASGERIFQLLDERPAAAQRAAAVLFRGLQDSLRLERVVFRYPSREAPALRGVTLEVRRGERVAIVGPSGSGKSTLLHLLLRLYDPVEGRILLDGRDLQEFDIKSVRERTGLVTQETTLFDESVSQNVALGRPSAGQDDVARACRTAGADAFISALPRGYSTQLGDRGLKLSGGQRQQLAIARAALKDPSLLLLDEATSSLDSASERDVQEALERLMEGRTVILAAHRLSTVQTADRIVVLKDGELVESGTHSQLISRNGLYRHLYEIQRAGPVALRGNAA